MSGHSVEELSTHLSPRLSSKNNLKSGWKISLLSMWSCTDHSRLRMVSLSLRSSSRSTISLSPSLRSKSEKWGPNMRNREHNFSKDHSLTHKKERWKSTSMWFTNKLKRSVISLNQLSTEFCKRSTYQIPSGSILWTTSWSEMTWSSTVTQWPSQVRSFTREKRQRVKFLRSTRVQLTFLLASLVRISRVNQTHSWRRDSTHLKTPPI